MKRLPMSIQSMTERELRRSRRALRQRQSVEEALAYVLIGLIVLPLVLAVLKEFFK